MMITPGILRFLLAFTVVLFHIIKYVFLGHWAVYVFFMLSGYWVTKMYIEKYQNLENPYWTYLKSRLLRLFPVHLLMLFLGAVSLSFYSDYYAIYSQKTMIEQCIIAFSNVFLLGGNYYYGHLVLLPEWSLDIELQFYIFLPFIIALINKNSNYFKILIFISTLIISSSFFINIPYLHTTFLYYLLFFLVGIGIYKYKFEPKSYLLYSSLATFFIIILLHYIIPELYLKTVDAPKDAPYSASLSNILAILFIPFVASHLHLKSNKLDIICGNLSYIIYLFHWVLIHPYRYYFKDIHSLEKVPYTLAYLFIVVLGSLIIYFLYDKPIENMRKKYLSNIS